MNTKVVMIGSAAFMAAMGMALSFLPDEIVSAFGLNNSILTVIVVQLLGAVYLGFAMLNWMSKGIAIGGIYNKPIAVGNFMHFAVGVLALVKVVSYVPEFKLMVIGLASIYGIFAFAFGYIFRTHPKIKH